MLGFLAQRKHPHIQSGVPPPHSKSFDYKVEIVHGAQGGPRRPPAARNECWETPAGSEATGASYIEGVGIGKSRCARIRKLSKMGHEPRAGCRKCRRHIALP